MRNNSQAADWLSEMENLLKACADKTRLRLLNMMAAEGEICVCDFVAVLHTNQPKISRHLAYLKRAGLVQDRKHGLWVYYRLTEPMSELATPLLASIVSSCQIAPELPSDVHLLQQLPHRQQPGTRTKGKAKKKVLPKEHREENYREIEIELL